MKQHIIGITGFMLFFCNIFFPQETVGQQKEITLNTAKSGTQTYIARDAIYLKPGFTYKAAQGASFSAKINESLVLPVDYLRDAPSVNNRTLDVNKPVGTTAGAVNVGPSGEATYQIPISAPPGIGGVQPSISLVYNSQAGNGLLGWGFNISGLSAITRVPQTIYSDGDASGVKNKIGDKYALDGNRLVSILSIYGSDGTEHTTETETYSKIYSRGNYEDNGPDRFEAIGKDGMKYFYGNSSGKVTYDDGREKQSVQCWLLDRVENPVNNQSVIYEYEVSDLSAYIKKITYGDNTIEFFYDTKTDVIPVHFDQMNGKITKILRKIVTRESGSTFRQYQLEYTKDMFSRLVKITESNSAGESFNPTIFEWGEYPAGNEIITDNTDIPASSFKDFAGQSYMSADINGDGLTDLFGLFPYEEKSGNRTSFYTLVQSYIASRNADNKIVYTDGGAYFLPPNIKSVIDEDKSKSYIAGNSIADMRGTGKQSLLFSRYNHSDKHCLMIFTTVSDSIGIKNYDPVFLQSSGEPVYAVGDVNNDGKTDIILFEKTEDIGHHYLGKILSASNDNTTDLNTVKFRLRDISGPPEKLFIEDFNGDGMKDIMFLTKQGYIIYWNEGGGLPYCFSNHGRTIGSQISDEHSRCEIGDFNGDGLPDFILNEPCNNKWHLALNDGKGGFNKKLLSGITDLNIIEENYTDRNDDKDRCIVHDFDGDGKSDLIISDSKYVKPSIPPKPFDSHVVYWLRSTGNDFELVKQSTYNKEDALNRYFATGDFNGDGMQELMFYGYDCSGNDQTDSGKEQKWRIYKKSGFTNQSGKITAISDGLLNKTTLMYDFLTNKSIYTKGAYAPYPVIDIQPALPVVVGMEQSIGNSNYGTTLSETYRYRGAKIHAQGRGFLGFRQIDSNNELLNIKTTATYNYNPTYYNPFVESKKITTSSGVGISEAIYTNSVLDNSIFKKKFFPYVEEAVETDLLKDITIKTKNVYNADGNISKTTVTAGNASKTDVTSVSDFTYKSVGGNGIPNKVSTITVNKTYTGQPAFTTKQEFEYNTKGILTKQTDFAHTSDKQVVTEYLDLNTLGLPGKVQTKAGSLDALTTSYQYDSKGRVSKTTDPLGLTASNGYDSKGRLVLTTDPQGNNTTYRYDSWGNLIQTYNPTGSVETQKTQWAISDDPYRPSNAVYKSISGTTGSPDNVTYFDAAGRSIRSVSVNINNQKIYVDKIYNAKGQLLKTTDPSFSSGNTNGTTYSYDDYGRITKESRHNNLVNTAYSYDKRTTTVKNAAEQKNTQTTNAAGDLISSKDGNGTEILYYFHSSGQPREIVADGVKTTIIYDNCGRQSSITDPSAGTKTFEYDARGNVTKETNALNQITTMKYDRYNRLEKKISPEFTTTYKYNETGLLTSEVTTNGTSTHYTYDKFGRTESVKDNAPDNKYLLKTYTYDNDYLNSVTYKSQTERIVVENYVYQYGHLYQIKLNNSAVIWQLNWENESGQPQAVTTGSLSRSYGYDAFNNPSTRTVGNIQNFSYGFDPKTGNLSYRKDNSRNKREDFLYDNLSRLTKYAGNTVVYDPQGNIRQRTDVGSFEYNTSGKPYAVSDATFNSAGLIAQRNQDVTYTSFSRPQRISEKLANGTAVYAADFVYDGSGDRVRMDLNKNGSRILRRYYISGQYESDYAGTDVKERLYLGGDAYSAPAVYVKQNGNWQIHYICRDYLGSITHVTNSNGALVQELSYDAWGRLRNPATQGVYAPDSEPELFLGRGYTGHEHLPMFGLINMNARLYDPLSGRFLSPDPYVQMPDFTQNFNRYSYALNNPLLYTDPDGEWFWLIPAAVGFVCNYVSHGVQNKDWGWNAVGAGVIGAGTALAMYFSGGATSAANIANGFASAAGNSYGVTAALGFSARYAGGALLNTALSQVIPPLNIPLSDNFGISVSPSAMMTLGVGSSAGGGFRVGVGIGAHQRIGDWTLSAGMNTQGKGIGSVYGGFSYDDGYRGFSYYHNWYMQGGKQQTGTIGGRVGDWSLSWENDVKFLMGDGNDRFRSNATEIGYKNYIFGTNVFTNNPKDEEGYTKRTHVLYGNENNGSKIFNNKYGTYKNGKTLSSPFYIGMRSKYGITRIGYNHPFIGDLIQNGFHHLPVIKSPNFHRGDFNAPYVQQGRYYPNTLY